jgi:hypothetical protein
MASWKDMLLDVLKLTDDVKQMNRDMERVEDRLIDFDKRVVKVEARLDTYVEIARLNKD